MQPAQLAVVAATPAPLPDIPMPPAKPAGLKSSGHLTHKWHHHHGHPMIAKAHHGGSHMALRAEGARQASEALATAPVQPAAPTVAQASAAPPLRANMFDAGPMQQGMGSLSGIGRAFEGMAGGGSRIVAQIAQALKPPAM